MRPVRDVRRELVRISLLVRCHCAHDHNHAPIPAGQKRLRLDSSLEPWWKYFNSMIACPVLSKQSSCLDTKARSVITALIAGYLLWY
jgi:hypothetical protein